ncbi:MAG: epoxyqueuosine reductase QueH [Candidatus Omnitrophica bacterium]|nr:epoxyqueuosine reductase QueH [Candidatus Omnitrophota bacterium]MBI5144099.1 epoxyqueuosine reductase QueH [Candidatus Omnitrophota bacterium]
MNILLHICCAPCAIAPVEELKKEGHKVTGYFYNPNVHPYSEYLKRVAEVERYSKDINLSVHYSDYDIENYFQHIVYNEALKNRCPVCWWLRLEKTAKYAKSNGFDSFTTTLLGSPYQDQDVVKEICLDVAKTLELDFYYKDFRPYFKGAHMSARSKGMYCQNYCGCVFSEKERIERSTQNLCPT